MDTPQKKIKKYHRGLNLALCGLTMNAFDQPFKALIDLVARIKTVLPKDYQPLCYQVEQGEDQKIVANVTIRQGNGNQRHKKDRNGRTKVEVHIPARSKA